MRSESLIRFESSSFDGASVFRTEKQLASAEIARQTQEYLDKGRKINALSSFIGTRPTFGFNADMKNGGVVDSVPAKQVVDGVTLLTIHRVAVFVGLSVSNVRVRAREGRFPKPASADPQIRWDEKDVNQWIAANG